MSLATVAQIGTGTIDDPYKADISSLETATHWVKLISNPADNGNNTWDVTYELVERTRRGELSYKARTSGLTSAERDELLNLLCDET